jgi:hypothetical protein
MPIDDGMPDLGNLPARTTAIRNKITGLVMTPESLAIGQMEPGEEDPWSRHVRYAYAHQDQMELLDHDPREVKDPVKGKGGDKESSVPTLKDGQPMTRESLEALHYQTLRALAKSYQVVVDGKTRLQVTEALLTAAYADAGLAAPLALDPRE